MARKKVSDGLDTRSASTIAVAKHRAGVRQSGGGILYVTMDQETATALNAVCERRIMDKRSAVAYALKRAAADAARKR